MRLNVSVLAEGTYLNLRSCDMTEMSEEGRNRDWWVSHHGCHSKSFPGTVIWESWPTPIDLSVPISFLARPPSLFKMFLP